MSEERGARMEWDARGVSEREGDRGVTAGTRRGVRKDGGWGGGKGKTGLLRGRAGAVEEA